MWRGAAEPGPASHVEYHCHVSFMPIYLKYNGIKGDITAEGYEGWVELDSFRWKLQRLISSPTGASADRESTAPRINSIVVTKPTDVASPTCSTRPSKAKVRPSPSTSAKPTRANWGSTCPDQLENCMISGYAVASGGERLAASRSC